MEEKIPPQDKEAEQSVLGAMMLSKDAIADTVLRLKPNNFYRDRHRFIFEAIIDLYQKSEPVDLITVCDELKKNNKLDISGGKSYIAEVLDSVPTVSNVQYYADIVSEKAVLRQLIDAGDRTIQESYEESAEVEDVLGNAQKRILDISKEPSNLLTLK